MVACDQQTVSTCCEVSSCSALGNAHKCIVNPDAASGASTCTCSPKSCIEQTPGKNEKKKKIEATYLIF